MQLDQCRYSRSPETLAGIVSQAIKKASSYCNDAGANSFQPKGA
jgi:hypothetical protein